MSPKTESGRCGRISARLRMTNFPYSDLRARDVILVSPMTDLHVISVEVVWLIAGELTVGDEAPNSQGQDQSVNGRRVV